MSTPVDGANLLRLIKAENDAKKRATPKESWWTKAAAPDARDRFMDAAHLRAEQRFVGAR